MSGGFVERELAVARELVSCRGDDARLDEADAEIAELRAERAALLEALKFIADHDLRGADLTVAGHIAHELIGKARAVIAKLKGGNDE
jgi:hypothetical protein